MQDEDEKVVKGVAVVPYCGSVTKILAMRLKCRNERTVMHPPPPREDQELHALSKGPLRVSGA